MREARDRSTDTNDADHARHLAVLRAAITDPRAFEPLYQRYSQDVYYFCYRRLSHPEDAADATSHIFVKALRGLPSYTPDPTNAGAAFRAWLFRIATTTVIDIQRRHRPSHSLDADGDDDHPLHLADPGRTPDEHLIGNEDARLVRDMLAKLPDRPRRIVELRLADLSGQEIADAMDISLSAVKSAQFRAFRTLRRLLEEPQPDTTTRPQP